MIKHLIIYRHDILIKNEQDIITLPSVEDIISLKPFLTIIHNDDELFVATINDPTLLEYKEHNLEFRNLRQALQHMSYDVVKLVVYYQQLTEYYRTHKYCMTCASHLTKSTTTKFMLCDKCSIEIYPHIAPCVIVRIHHEDKILMARGVNFPPNSWGLIAGFVELGESLEEAVKREVLEEVGIEIEDVEYFSSQPWPFPGSTLMVGFTAKYKSGEIKLQEEEIEAAGFYTANNMPGRPSSSFSISSLMINDFYHQALKD